MNKTAALIIIGNEILSGRTQDKNAQFLAKELGLIGVTFSEIRVVPDKENEIIFAVNELKKKYDYIFTTGGIGPTHDDITSSSVAKAFGKKLMRNVEAVNLLKSHYKPEDLNEARLKMADIPEGATLIENPVSKAPGFILENVFVMAGVPSIMQAMFAGVKHLLKTGAPVKSKTISTNLTEGLIAKGLTEIQNGFSDVEIGSYPYFKDGKIGVSLVARGLDDEKITIASKKIEEMLKSLGGKVLQGE